MKVSYAVLAEFSYAVFSETSFAVNADASCAVYVKIFLCSSLNIQQWIFWL